MTKQQFHHEYDFKFKILNEICLFKNDTFNLNSKSIKKICLDIFKKYGNEVDNNIRYMLRIYEIKIRVIALRFETIKFRESIVEVQKSILQEQTDLIKKLEDYMNQE